MTDAIDKLDELYAKVVRPPLRTREDPTPGFDALSKLHSHYPAMARVIRAVEDYRAEQANPSKDYTMVRQRLEQMFDALDALDQEVK